MALIKTCLSDYCVVELLGFRGTVLDACVKAKIVLNLHTKVLVSLANRVFSDVFRSREGRAAVHSYTH